jgi:hypothetical protein
MNTPLAGLLCGVLLLGGAAQAATPQTQKKSLEKFAPYLQDPVDQFAFPSLYKWQPAGADKVAVWSSADEAYLLTVETPCEQLQSTAQIELSQQASHTVTRQVDSVTAGSDRCRILEIEPIDVRKMEGKPSKPAEPAGDEVS